MQVMVLNIFCLIGIQKKLISKLMTMLLTQFLKESIGILERDALEPIELPP